MLSTGLTMLAGAYCAGTYYFHKDYVKDITDKKHGWGWRTYATCMFVFSPVTVPIELAVLAFVY